MTVYDRIQTMPKDELQTLLYYIYLWGHINEQCGVDDECFYKHLLNFHGCHVDDIINAMEDLSLYHIQRSFFYGGSAYYMDTKFFSIEDATNYIMRHCTNVRKIDGTTYATEFEVLRIIPIMRGGEANAHH